MFCCQHNEIFHCLVGNKIRFNTLLISNHYIFLFFHCQQGNTEDEEEEEYSSEGENGISSPKNVWSVTNLTPNISHNSSARPLNPECQEFHLRLPLASNNNNINKELVNAVTAHENSNEIEELSTVNLSKIENLNNNNLMPLETSRIVTNSDVVVAAVEKRSTEDCVILSKASQALVVLKDDADNDLNSTRLIHENFQPEDEGLKDNDHDEKDNQSIREILDGVYLLNNDNNSKQKSQNFDGDVAINSNTSLSDDQEERMLDRNTNRLSNAPSKRKFSAKSLKFVREPTPGPSFDAIDNVDMIEEKNLSEYFLLI